jgi:hypothetical protein
MTGSDSSRTGDRPFTDWTFRCRIGFQSNASSRDFREWLQDGELEQNSTKSYFFESVVSQRMLCAGQIRSGSPSFGSSLVVADTECHEFDSHSDRVILRGGCEIVQTDAKPCGRSFDRSCPARMLTEAKAPVFPATRRQVSLRSGHPRKNAPHSIRVGLRGGRKWSFHPASRNRFRPR